jgi:hypothetical protein
MSLNINPTASQKNMKKLPVSEYFSFIACVVDICDRPLLSNISTNFRKKLKWSRAGPRRKIIHEKKPEVENLESDSLYGMLQ